MDISDDGLMDGNINPLNTVVINYMNKMNSIITKYFIVFIF